MPDARLSATASSLVHSSRIEITPKDANTVPCPMIRGIAAATGDRKTSSRTMIRIGAARSSALWAPSVVASLMSRPSGASPAKWGSTGSLTRCLTNRCRGGTTVLRVCPRGISRSSTITAVSSAGLSRLAPLLALQGESARVCGRRARSRASRGPWRSSSSFGPRTSTAASSPNVPLRSSSHRAGSVPGTSSWAGLTLSSTPRPAKPTASTNRTQHATTSLGRRSAKRATRLTGAPL